MENKIWTRDEIKFGIETYDKWLYRSILAIYNYQTDSEKLTESTRESNSVGFNGCDAKILSSFADQLNRYGRLSDKQKMIARKKMVKYSGQLVNIANKNI